MAGAKSSENNLLFALGFFDNRGQLKCVGTRAENRFRLSRGTDQSI